LESFETFDSGEMRFGLSDDLDVDVNVDDIVIMLFYSSRPGIHSLSRIERKAVIQKSVFSVIA
jgi:hypothetical protein